MGKTILFGERVEKTASNPEGWDTFYDGERDDPKLSESGLLGKKSIVVFPGDGAFSERAANGSCRSVQSILQAAGIPPEQMPHIYGLGYLSAYQKEHRIQVLTDLKMNQLYWASKEDNSLSEDQLYWQPFFDEYIQPLIADENANPRPVSEIRKNLQNVTFVSHCHGGFVAYQIEKMLSEKLKEFYPEQSKDLMSNVRMIHFSSRRPIGHSFGGKHFDIISQYDDEYADYALLEHDNILKQIHRANLGAPSALIPISDKEEVLLLKRVAGFLEENQRVDDHNAIMAIFGNNLKGYELSQNQFATLLVQELLRHFVEHPEDKRSLNDILTELNPKFTEENTQTGQNLLTEEKEIEKIHRETLSLLASPAALIDTGRSSKKIDVYNTFLRERDTSGRFLSNTLTEQYQKTGDSRSLIRYVKNIHCLLIPKTKMLSLISTAVQKKDWKLLEAIFYKNGNKMMFGYFSKSSNTERHFSKMISSVEPEDLYHLLPLLQIKEFKDILENNPKMLDRLINKVRKVKKVLHRNALLSFMEKSFPDAPTQRAKTRLASFLAAKQQGQK